MVKNCVLARPSLRRPIHASKLLARQHYFLTSRSTTSGRQVVTSTEQLRTLGGSIASVVCVIDRQAGGAEALSSVGLRGSALFTKEQLEATR